MYAKRKTKDKIKGIDVAVFNAFLNHKNNIKIKITINIESIKSFISSDVAISAFSHSF
jgi:hypothetical protein